MHIHYLAMMGKLDELKQLLEERSELLNAQDGELRDTPLMLAAYSCKVAVVKCLLSRGADIYIRNSYGENILHGLTLYISNIPIGSTSERLTDYYTIVEMVLQRDAELRAVNSALVPLLEVKSRGRTPLWILNDTARQKIQLMARAAEARVQHKRALVARAHEDKEARYRGSVYSATVPKVSEPAKKYGGFARLLAAFGIMRRGPQAPEEVPLLKGKLKVS